MALGSKADVAAYIEDRKNWGRWGEDVDALAGGRAVTPQGVEATAAAQGVGLLRTVRWVSEGSSTEMKPHYDDPPDVARWGLRVGWHPACMPWLHEREVAVIGCDGPQDLPVAVFS